MLAVKGLLGACATQISYAWSLTTALRRAALRPQTADKSLLQPSQAHRLNLPSAGGPSGRMRLAAIVRGGRCPLRACSNGVAPPRRTSGRCRKTRKSAENSGRPPKEVSHVLSNHRDESEDVRNGLGWWNCFHRRSVGGKERLLASQHVPTA
jgi:hypothetical protein